MPVDTRAVPIRVLMLHGFTQSGQIFEFKTRRLTQRLSKTLCERYRTREENVRFIYADGPFSLQNSDEAKWGEGEVGVAGAGTLGWWRNLDITEQYKGIETSLSLLASLVKTHGPFTGVVGFSQGATLGAMFTSCCEMDIVPGRREALQEMCHGQNPELAQILALSPQKQLDFSILFSGWKGTPEYYHGFYDPPLQSPTVHVLGTLDTMIPRWGTLQLLDACQRALMVEHPGVHFVPRSHIVIEKVVRSVEQIVDTSWFGTATPTLQFLSPLGDGVTRPSRSHPGSPHTGAIPLVRRLPSLTMLSDCDDIGYQTNDSMSRSGTQTPCSQSSSGRTSMSGRSYRGIRIVRRYMLANVSRRS